MNANARTADFAATAPWAGITNKPRVFPTAPDAIDSAGAPDHGILVWSTSQRKWVPVSLATLKGWLNALP